MYMLASLLRCELEGGAMGYERKAFGNDKAGEAETAGVLEEIVTIDTCVRQ